MSQAAAGSLCLCGVGVKPCDSFRAYASGGWCRGCGHSRRCHMEAAKRKRTGKAKKFQVDAKVKS